MNIFITSSDVLILKVSIFSETIFRPHIDIMWATIFLLMTRVFEFIIFLELKLLDRVFLRSNKQNYINTYFISAFTKFL